MIRASQCSSSTITLLVKICTDYEFRGDITDSHFCQNGAIFFLGKGRLPYQNSIKQKDVNLQSYVHSESNQITKILIPKLV
jgi:hypothetical protein